MSAERTARRRRILVIAGASVAAVAAHAGALAFFADRDPYAETIFPPCPWLAATGWQCPACGGTRALYSLLHLDVAQSWRLNPLVILLYAVAAIVVAGLVAHARGRPRVANAVFWAVPVVLVPALAYTAVIRNLL